MLQFTMGLDMQVVCIIQNTEIKKKCKPAMKRDPWETSISSSNIVQETS